MGEITFEHPLDGARRVLRLDVAIDLTAERRVGPEAATHIHVIAFERLLALLPLAGKKADIANVVLRARMMTPGEMNIDRAIHMNAAFAPLRDFFGVPLGIGCRETAGQGGGGR